MSAFSEIQEVLRQRADYEARLKLLPYDGTPEIKSRGEQRYLYCRKRIGSRTTSTYIGPYSEELHQQLLRDAREARERRKLIRHADKKLAELGYVESDLYDQAVLEGVATSFPQTEEIIENGRITGMSPTDVQKILNLKHAWEFILGRDVIQAESDYYVLCHIAKLVNEGFYAEGGRIRGVPVRIGGTTYVPPLPIEIDVRDHIQAILHSGQQDIDVAIELCLYAMKTQVFIDGNKRASVIYANHYLIAHGQGFLVIPEEHVPEFKKLLVRYYEGEDIEVIRDF